MHCDTEGLRHGRGGRIWDRLQVWGGWLGVAGLRSHTPDPHCPSDAWGGGELAAPVPDHDPICSGISRKQQQKTSIQLAAGSTTGLIWP